MEREIRQLTTQIELRSMEDGTDEQVIEGYALKFNTWSERLGFFKETLDQRSLDSTDMNNVVALFNHKEDYPLARNTVAQGNGSLELSVDNIGLKFRFKPTDTTYARDLMVNIRSGVINQCSFAFSMDYNDDTAEEWKYNDAESIYERKINKIERLYDISLVTTPAYQDTEAVVGARSLEKVEQLKEQRMKPQVDIEKEKLMIQLDLLKLQ